MSFGNRIGNKIEHNTDGQKETKQKSCLNQMKICWQSVSLTEWLVLLLIIFTIVVLIFLNFYAYPNDKLGSDTIGTSENGSLLSNFSNHGPSTPHDRPTTQRIGE